MTKIRSAGRWLWNAAIRAATDATWVLVTVLALSLASSAFSIRYLAGLDSDISDIVENDIKGQTYAQNAYVRLLQMESTAKDLALAASEEDRTGNVAALARQSNAFQDMVGRATSTLDATLYRTLVARTRSDAATLVGLMKSELGKGISTAEQGRSFLSRLQSVIEPVRSDIQTVNDLKRRANNRGLRAVRIQLRVSLAVTIAILLASVGVRLFIYRSQRRASSKRARR